MRKNASYRHRKDWCCKVCSLPLSGWERYRLSLMEECASSVFGCFGRGRGSGQNFLISALGVEKHDYESGCLAGLACRTRASQATMKLRIPSLPCSGSSLLGFYTFGCRVEVLQFRSSILTANLSGTASLPNPVGIEFFVCSTV